jgi:uncharacterized membrane protein YgaE (UPF0421/DUF939 family)
MYLLVLAMSLVVLGLVMSIVVAIVLFNMTQGQIERLEVKLDAIQEELGYLRRRGL